MIIKVNDVMLNLRGLLLSAKMQELKRLRHKVRNVTRLSSTRDMIARYVELRNFLPSLWSRDIYSISLTPSENRRVDVLLKLLEPLGSDTKTLQKDETTVSDTRALFDAVIESYPETTNNLSSSADILHCAVF